MSTIHSRREATVTIAAAAVAALSIVVFGIAHAVNAWAYDREFSLLDAGTGSSAFEWIGTATVSLSAAALVVIGRRESDHLLMLMAGLLAVVAVIDLTGLHKHVTGGKLLLVPVLLPILVLLWRLPRSYGIARSALRIGLVLLAFSLVVGTVAERVVNRQGWTHGDAGYELKILLKDGSEVAGWTLVAAGTLAGAVAAGSRGARR
jgi:hypothetical protein